MWAALLVALIGAAPEPKKDGPPPKRELRIEATCLWRAGKVGPPLEKVVRSDAELLALMGLAAGKEKEARANLEKHLKVKVLDWNKQMLIVVVSGPTAYFDVEVTALTVTGVGKDRKLTVRWQVKKGFAAMPLRRPGLAVLTERFEGPVQFAQTLPPAPKKGPEPK
jgi:hypothetical protein